MSGEFESLNWVNNFYYRELYPISNIVSIISFNTKTHFIQTFGKKSIFCTPELKMHMKYIDTVEKTRTDSVSVPAEQHRR